MKKTGLIALALWLHLFAVAQDTHYWTHQLGTRSALMGGAVVGGTRDNSMIFYNPAAVAFIDSSSFSINANVYQVENIRIQNILTDEKEFSSLQLSSVPLLTSGQFKTKAKNLRLAYGIFSPVAFQFRGTARIQGQYAVVPDDESPGAETFVGDQNLFVRLRELVVAFGVSYKLSEQWSVGLTNLFDVRSHHYNRELFSRYYLNDTNSTGVSTSFTQSFNYWNARYMPKVGVAFRGSKWSWGATVTAPGIRLLGSGGIGVDILAANVKDGATGRRAVVANSREKGLKSYFKSPYSAAIGFQFKQGKTAIAFSTQYFGKQGVYTILKAEEAPFVRPASAYSLINGNDLASVKTAARPVLNIALGVEQELNERLSLHASIRNNQSYYDAQLLNQNGIKPDVTTWDIYHLVGGVTRRRERSSMSLGLALGYGQDKKRSDQNLPLPSQANFFKNPVTITQASYTSLGILIGYNYFFKKG
jgi:hypothetical protein